MEFRAGSEHLLSSYELGKLADNHPDANFIFLSGKLVNVILHHFGMHKCARARPIGRHSAEETPPTDSSLAEWWDFCNKSLRSLTSGELLPEKSFLVAELSISNRRMRKKTAGYESQ